MIALFAAIGGGYAVAKKHGDKKADKKLINKQINKKAPGLSVAHATTASEVGTEFNASGGDQTVTTLAENNQWRVVGLCDHGGTLTVPGFDNGYNTRHGSAIGIVDKSENHAFADSSDDNDDDFNPGDGIAFNYTDGGDGGGAVAPDGHAVFVLGGGNLVIEQSGSTPGFPGSGCTFAGFAVFH
jgi:hypothetical protein